MNRQQIGSMTAKGGFLNEQAICQKFIQYKTDDNAQIWLGIMGYKVEKIESLSAIHIPTRISKKRAEELGITPEKHDETIKYKKADIQIRIEIIIDGVVYLENISLKKANQTAGFNQVDKRPVDQYKMMWDFDQEIAYWLKAFTGAITPDQLQELEQPKEIRDSKKRRLFLDEIPFQQLEKIITFFNNNKTLIVSDILRGRGGFSAEWFLVTRKDTKNDNTIDWLLKDINTVCNFYAQGDVKLSPQGSLKIGRITAQRKGGTPDPTSLQFKINPLQLFEGSQ